MLSPQWLAGCNIILYTHDVGSFAGLRLEDLIDQLGSRKINYTFGKLNERH